MTQRALASAIGMRETTVSQILNGDQAPQAETLAVMCKHLRVHPSWIMLGLEPRYFEDSAHGLAPVQVPQPALLGVDQWLADMGVDVTSDERAWMRAVPWPTPHVRQSDTAYLMALAAYRQARPVSAAAAAVEKLQHP
jgi:transcriptional regulator with XRE-family HTH domain